MGQKLTTEQLVERLVPYLDPQIRKLVEEQNEKLQGELSELKQKATDFGPLLAKLGAGTSGDETPKPEKGHALSRFAHYKLRARVEGRTPLQVAEAAGDQWAIKTLQASDDAGMGVLIPEEVSGDIIPELIAESVVGRFNPMQVRLAGNSLRFPRIDTGASATWIGEGAEAPASEQTTGSVTLTPHKLAVVVPISNDLVRRAPQNAEQVIRSNTTANINATVDLAWIRGSGSGGQPAGFLNQPGIGSTASAGTSVANIVNDLGVAMQALKDANVPMTRPGFLISPRTERALFTLLDSNSNPVFRDEMAARGTLLGIPFAVTSQIPTNLGGGNNESEVYLVDFAQVIIGEQVPLSVDLFDQATITDASGSARNLMQRDEIAMRFIVETDMALQHAAAVHVTTGVTWGA